MSDTGKQSPLGVNVLGGFLQNKGLRINPVAAGYMGSSTLVSTYTYGSVVNNTVLKLVTDAIRQGWIRYDAAEISSTTYENLISIGATTIPALGNTKPPTFTWIGSPGWGGIEYTDEIASFGYVRLFAWQAYNEYRYSGSTAYKDFIGSFQTASSFITVSNKAITTMQNSLTFLDGTYSNMNDLISADLTGITLSTTLFGQDLILSGKAINLAKMASFGLPSNLLETLRRYNAITPSLSVALLASGLTSNDVNQLTANVETTVSQQQKAYAAFLVIKGIDLLNILVPLNCRIQGLESLADLLDIRKLFPNSYDSLTVPLYNAAPGPTNSKTYYPIFQGTGVSSSITSPAVVAQVGSQIPPGTPTNGQTGIDTGNIQNLAEGFGSYLVGIVPEDIAVTAGAFSTTMLQVRNITNIPIEKFAQVVTTIETTRGLAVNGTNIPVDAAEAQVGLSLVAFGSGPFGTYTYSDFFGCMSGLPYPWANIQQLIQYIQTPALAAIYQDLYDATLSPADPGLDALIQGFIDDANAEIASIFSNTANVNISTLNSLWSGTGTQLTNEQHGRVIALANASGFPYPLTIYGMVDSIPAYAPDTAPNMGAQTWEAIANLSIIAGQSVVALLRSARNQARLSSVGITLDDNISDVFPIQFQTELIANGVISNGEEFPAYPAQIDAAGAEIVPIPAGIYDPVTEDYLLNGTTPTGGGGGGGGQTAGTQFRTPAPTGGPIVPGSLAGSPFSTLIPPQLDPIYTSDILLPAPYAVSAAIEEVIRCNCDCWIQ